MKIVSFPHYTCGGLLCDILNDTWSSVGTNGGISSINHTLGKIGDSASIFADYDVEKVKNFFSKSEISDWAGTHCWLGPVIDHEWTHSVINVTTMTHRSRLYRWVRAYHHYYMPSSPWQGLEGIDFIDKQRETAKNYLQPFPAIHHPCVQNIEFADIVENQQSFRSLVGDATKHLDRWKSINGFLYDPMLWTSDPAQRFYEAEYEIELKQMYQYE